MNNFGIAFLVTLLGCVVADQPPVLSKNDICEASREPLRQFEDCMSSKMLESVKNIMDKFLECLEEPSFVSLLDRICEGVNSGISDEEIFEELGKCSLDRLGVVEPPIEDQHHAAQVQDACLVHLMPYFEIAMEKAAADKYDV